MRQDSFKQLKPNFLRGLGSVLTVLPYAQFVPPARNPGQLDQQALRKDLSRTTEVLQEVTRDAWASYAIGEAFQDFSGIDKSGTSDLRIKVIGLGGAGGAIIERMIDSGVQHVEYICANTDAQALNLSRAHRLVQLGTTGLGAGSDPELGRQAALANKEHILEAIKGSDILFVAAGLGGGTGTGAAPVVASIARALGILTVGIVTQPFVFEGNRRMNNAKKGLDELSANIDSLIVVSNEKLLELPGGENFSQDEAFAKVGDVLVDAVRAITSITKQPSNYVNVDFEDVRTVMSEQGRAIIGTAVAGGPDRARIAAEKAIACPLQERVGFSSARGVLVLISGSRSSLKLKESRQAMNTILNAVGEDAHIIMGSVYDETLADQVRVTVVVTGLKDRAHQSLEMDLVVLRSGTHGAHVGAHVDLTNSEVNPAPLDGTYFGNAPPGSSSNRSKTNLRAGRILSTGLNDLEIPAFLRKQAD